VNSSTVMAALAAGMADQQGDAHRQNSGVGRVGTANLEQALAQLGRLRRLKNSLQQRAQGTRRRTLLAAAA
jgi:hypothetical protein